MISLVTKEFRTIVNQSTHDARITLLSTSFSALSESNRLVVFHALIKNGATSVGRLARTTGMSDALTSQHLKILFHAKVVLRERQGKYVFYRINSTNPLVQAIEPILSSY